MTRISRLTASAAVAAALIFAVPGSAAAATLPPTIEVSPDGTVYSQEFDGLFEGTVLVPQASSSDTFSLRNVSDSNVYVRIVLTDVEGSSPLLLSSLTLNVAGSGWTSEPLILSDATPCLEVTTGVALQGGASMTIDADVSMADLVGQQAQQETARFSLHIVATEHVDRPGATACAAASAPPVATPTPPQLGVTGGTLSLAVALVGVFLIGSGAAFVAWRRSSRRGDAQ
jgi:hypothetical protein